MPTPPRLHARVSDDYDSDTTRRYATNAPAAITFPHETAAPCHFTKVVVSRIRNYVPEAIECVAYLKELPQKLIVGRRTGKVAASH
jgi:hypothetical protein